jgi:DNA-binding protein Fis
MDTHVLSRKHEKFNFIYDFKDVLGKLGVVGRVKDVIPVTKNFLTQAFGIPEDKSFLIVRDSLNKEKNVLVEPVNKRSLYIEKVFSSNTDNTNIVSFVNKNKIIIRDEVEFTNFYNKMGDCGENLENVVKFLEKLEADVFLPVFSDSKLVAAIIIDRGARPKRFYTDVERDEMLIYSEYLGSVLYLLTHMNLETVLQKQKELRSEIYKKNKTISLFKKGVFSFFEKGKKHRVGVLTYKNKRFAYCNQVSRDIIPVDLNYDKGLGVTQKMTQLANDVATFFTPRHSIVTGADGKEFVVDATPNIEKNNTIITVSGPRMSDFIGKQLILLKDQSKWASLLALKSTSEGDLVNQLLPADTQMIINTKVSFFENATTRKLLLFEMPSKEDAYAFASVVHKINNRKIFEIIKICYGGDDFQIAKRIFGINPIFEHEDSIGLLESLNKRGTLFIRNIHLLSMDLQRQFLEFIKTGRYLPLKSDEHKESDVLLLFSTNRNLFDLVQKGLFLKELYLELRKGTMWLPSLVNLSNDEFLALAEGIRQQVVSAKLYQNLLVFNDSDKKRLIESGCVSLHELKSKVQNIVLKKTKRQSLKDVAVIDPASTVSDIDLAAAARLGRHALKDPKTLTLLMKRFKNSQSRIALFLGVNRSTVSRRCSQYNIKID